MDARPRPASPLTAPCGFADGANVVPGEGAAVDVHQVDQPGVAERGLENWAQALFEGIDDAVFVHDLQGRILEANPAACQRLGYTREELLRLSTSDIDAPEFAEGFGERLRQQLSTGGVRCEGRHRTKDGRVIPVDINSSAIIVGGEPAVLAVMRDITERKRAEEALRKQSELLGSILSNMADAVLVTDDHGRVLAFNPASERLLGVSEADVGSADWQKRYRAFGQDKVTPLPHRELPLTRAIRGEQVNDLEVFLRHDHVPRGHWLSVSGGPLRDGRGSVKGGVIVCRDVTPRKRAERRLAAQYAVTRALADADAPEQAAPDVLQALCVGLGWDVAALWVVREGAGVLHCAGVWHRPALAVEEFVAASRAAAFFPGEGVPGRVWGSGRDAWIPDLAADDNFTRLAPAQAAGLRAAYAFPARSGGALVGVVEGYSRSMERPDADALSMTAALGSQIGHVLERQRVEHALRESEAFYHSLVESLPQNIFRKDLEGRVTFGNQRYCAMLGRPLKELIGRTDFDLFPADLAAKYRGDDLRVQESGVPLELVEEHVLPGGKKLHVQVIKTPIRDGQGKVIGTQGMFWDVTERKRAEEVVAASERRYRQLTEATLDGIVVADREGRVTLFNPAAERIFGYRAAEVVGKPLDLLIPAEHLPGQPEGLDRYLAGGLAQFAGRAVELHGRRKDGASFPLELALSVIDGGAGGDVQFLGAVRDLTERNRIRAVLIQNEKLASIGLLSAGVAHEINNPLAFVGNNLAVLERDLKGLMELLVLYQGASAALGEAAPGVAERAAVLAEEMDLEYIRANLPRLLSRTRDGVDRVTRIVHSLRGLARTDPPRKQETHLPDLVETSLEIIRGRLRRRGVQVEVDYDPNPRVRCVSTQISQVLLNLLVNALQALEERPPAEGAPRIRVRAVREGDDMVIEVADNGPGIEAAVRQRIFDPFFTTKDVGEGTGLGLSICHNIVTGHGGRIEVDSLPGAGTCFRVSLPLHTARDDS
jgi:PAS domain S-box-containing protein